MVNLSPATHARLVAQNQMAKHYTTAATSRHHAPTFGAGDQKSHPLRSLLLPAALALPALGIGLAPGMIQPAQAQTPVTAQNKINTGSKAVNNAKDIAQVNGPNLGSQQKVIDTVPPLLSPQATQRLNDALGRLNNIEGAVVIIPSTTRSDMNDLATDIYNQIGIGKQGQNKGFLLLVNADGVHNLLRGKQMTLKPGHGSKNILSNDVATRILIKNAVDPIKARDYDKAVEDTVKATIDLLENQSQGNGGSTGGELSPEGAALLGQVLLGLLALIAIGAGTYKGGTAISRWHKNRKQDAQVIEASLKQMGSTSRPGPLSVYSFRTARTLLTTTSDKADIGLFKKALDVVEKGIDEKSKADYRKLYIEKGLNHPTPAVREEIIERLAKDGVTADLFKPFMARLGVETDAKVIDVLEEPLVKLSTAANAAEFGPLAQSPLPGVRKIHIEVLDKFFDTDQGISKKDTMERYFTLLRAEPTEQPENIHLLSGIINKRIQENNGQFDELALKNFKEPNNDLVKMVSLLAVGATGNGKYFDDVYEEFKTAEQPQLRKPYDEVLKALVNTGHLEKLFPGLQDEKPWVQEETLNLLDHVDQDPAVPQLFNYLKTPGSQFKEKAVGVLVNNAEAPSHPLLLQELSAESNLGLPLVRLASAQGLGKLEQSKDVTALFTALEKETEKPVILALDEAITTCAHDENQPELQSKLGSERSAVRYSAARALKHLAKPENVTPLLTAFASEKAPEVDGQLQKAILASVAESNLKELHSKLDDQQARVRLLAANALKKVDSSSSVAPMFTRLNKEADDTVKQALNEAIIEATEIINQPELHTQLGSKTAINRRTAAQGLEKLSQVSSMANLFAALEGEADAGVKGAIQSALAKVADRPEALEPLSQVVVANQNADVQLMAIGMLDKFNLKGAKALFNGLAATTGKTSAAVISAYRNTILKNTQSDDALKLLKERAAASHREVSGVAAESADRLLNSWKQSKTYDDATALTWLNDLMTHPNTTVSQTAGAVKTVLMDTKVKELEKWGGSSVEDNSAFNKTKNKLKESKKTASDEKVRDSAEANYTKLVNRRIKWQKEEAASLAGKSVSSSSSYNSHKREIEDIVQNAENSAVKSDAEAALRRLKKRRSDYEDDERRRSQASSSSSSSSYGGGGWSSSDSGGGFSGGFSSGGGGSI